MKLNFLTILLFCGPLLSAQLFTEKTGTPFHSAYKGSIAFADVDGDGDQDVLITGENNSIGIAKLYTNDGLGNFTEKMGTPFEGVEYSAVAFADVDGDNDQDVLITGRNAASNQIAKLYTNDGLGNFTVKTGTPFYGVQTSSVAFADVDGDNDLDVLIAGNGPGGPTTILYTNNGNGNFTEKTGTSFVGIYIGDISFADVDGDSDLDVLITGRGNSSVYVAAELYINNGNGNFTEKSNAPFGGQYAGSTAFADVDGDADQDVLVTGLLNGNMQIAKLYTNSGNGNFSEKTGVPFNGVQNSSVTFADVDGDNDQDALISGLSSAGTRITKLYANDGTGNFTLMSDSFLGTQDGDVAFADVDGDNDLDLLVTSHGSSKLYINNQCINSSATIIVSACDSYTSPSGNDTWTTGGVYNDIIPNAGGCDSIITIDLSIESIDLTVNQTGNTLTATEEAADSYQWLDCNNGNMPIADATDPSYTATANGSYALEMVKGPCTKVTACTAVIGVGIKEEFQAGISVYPNPTNGQFLIDLGQYYPTMQVEILNSLGQVIDRKEYAGSKQLDLTIKGPAAVYFVKLHNGEDAVSTFRIVKK